jgi:hypothetical protein
VAKSHLRRSIVRKYQVRIHEQIEIGKDSTQHGILGIIDSLIISRPMSALDDQVKRVLISRISKFEKETALDRRRRVPNFVLLSHSVLLGLTVACIFMTRYHNC